MLAYPRPINGIKIPTGPTHRAARHFLNLWYLRNLGSVRTSNFFRLFPFCSHNNVWFGLEIVCVKSSSSKKEI